MPYEFYPVYEAISILHIHKYSQLFNFHHTSSELIEHLNVDNLHFTSNHASNFVPIEGTLNTDKEKISKLLDEAIAGTIPKRSNLYRGL